MQNGMYVVFVFKFMCVKHGRLKVKTTEEQQEAKRKEREKKLKIYNLTTTKIFEKVSTLTA